MDLTALATLDCLLETNLPSATAEEQQRELHLLFAKEEDAREFAQALNLTFGGLREPLPPVTLGEIPTRFAEIRCAIEAVVRSAITPGAKRLLARFLAERWVAEPPRWNDQSGPPNYYAEYSDEPEYRPEITLVLRPYDPGWLEPLYKVAEEVSRKPQLQFKEGEGGVYLGSKFIPVKRLPALRAFKAICDAYPKRITAKEILKLPGHNDLPKKIHRLVASLPTPLKSLIDSGKGKPGYRLKDISKP